MADEAKPMMERFLAYYSHVMVDLRDPRFVSCELCIKSNVDLRDSRSRNVNDKSMEVLNLLLSYCT